MLKKFLKNSKGATAIEYALIAALIAMIAISGMRFIGNMLNDKLINIANGFAED